jgi:hypothetical protein
MQSLSKFDGIAVALSTVTSLQSFIPRFGLKEDEEGKTIEIMLTQSRTNKAGEKITTGFPLKVEVKEGATFAHNMGAVFTYLRRAIGRMGLNRNLAVNLALSMDGVTVSTSQIQYGGVKGRAFLPALRKDESESEFQKRANDAFRSTCSALTAQILEVMLPESYTIDEKLEERLKQLVNG